MSEETRVNLLLVDDRPENLLALTAIIERDDYHLVTAASGEEALLLIMKYEFAVILMDVQMPGIDGFEAAKIIKAREKTKNIPIIFISANNMESSHIFTGYSVGAIDYILKPFDPYILKAKVENFVEMYRLGRKIIHQAHRLSEQKAILEKANAELSETTLRMRESEALANVINETSIDSMIVMSQDGIILKVNPAFSRMFQYGDDEMIGSSVLRLFAGDKDKSYVRTRLEAPHLIEDGPGGRRLDEITAIRKDATEFPAEIQMGMRYVKDKCFIACTICDITQKKKDEEIIVHMAYHDGLTGLPNRRLFYDKADDEIAESKRSHRQLAVLYLDLDRFKYVNDSLGHQVGDSLLQNVARRLEDALREGDVLARVGGDEFNLLLPATNRESAIDAAERIMEQLRRPFHVDQYELHLTASIGISIFPYDGEDRVLLMKQADAALYHAKEQGKNQFNIFHSGMNIRSYRNYILQNDLRMATERGEMVLYYQPIIEVESGAVIAAEALPRWNHPSWGILLPEEFLPLAEETGQIIDIGDWVVAAACEQRKRWKEDGYKPIRMTVNLSPRQLMQKDLGERLEAILAETGCLPQDLEIELQEIAFMSDEIRVAQLLAGLRKIGVTISVDDFGAGHASLPYLCKFPIDTIKIDKSFVQAFDSQSEESLAYLAAMIALAKHQNLKVIAERVESEELWQMLKRFDCRLAQGNWFFPPLPEPSMRELLRPEGGRKPPAERQYQVREVTLSVASASPDFLDAALLRAKQLYGISTREFEVFQLMAEGMNNKSISEKLYISEHTVKNHITHIFQKLNVPDRLQALAMIYQYGLEESKKFRLQE